MPLVIKLSQHVQHLDFAGSYLPLILKSDESIKLWPSTVSISVLYHSQRGDPWVDNWTERSKYFKELAYGSSDFRW